MSNEDKKEVGETTEIDVAEVKFAVAKAADEKAAKEAKAKADKAKKANKAKDDAAIAEKLAKEQAAAKAAKAAEEKAKVAKALEEAEAEVAAKALAEEAEAARMKVAAEKLANILTQTIPEEPAPIKEEKRRSNGQRDGMAQGGPGLRKQSAKRAVYKAKLRKEGSELPVVVDDIVADGSQDIVVPEPDRTRSLGSITGSC